MQKVNEAGQKGYKSGYILEPKGYKNELDVVHEKEVSKKKKKLVDLGMRDCKQGGHQKFE